MPAFGGKLPDDEIRAVLAYIKSRWSPEVLRLRAEMLMTEGLGHRRILRHPDVVAAAVSFVAARSAERGIAAAADAEPQATPLEILMGV